MSIRHRRTSLPARLSLCAAALLVLSACGDGGGDSAANDGTTASSSPTVSPSPTPTDTPSSEPSDSPSTTAPTPASPTAQKALLINYAGGESPGVVVHDRAGAKDLRGAPASFKQFIGTTAQKIADTSKCDAGAVGVTVQTLRTDGFAVGGVNDCGGYAAMWAEVDGHWQEIQGTQDSWECAVLEKYAVPSDVAGTTCYDYDAQKEHKYHQK